jgi:hypothetical protein
VTHSSWISGIFPNLHSNLRFFIHKCTSLFEPYTAYDAKQIYKIIILFNDCVGYRHEVEERRLQLEVLERRLFPASGVVPPLHRDSLTSLDNLTAIPPPEESPAATSAASQLEDAFKKLMVATGA